MTKEYYVMKSKYKVKGKYLNALTYCPSEGVYRCYRQGELEWEEKGANNLYEAIKCGEFYSLDYEEGLEKYPIAKRYMEHN